MDGYLFIEFTTPPRCERQVISQKFSENPPPIYPTKKQNKSIFSLAFLLDLCYTTRMTEINTSLVSDLTFIEITDTLRPHQWADWYVEFSYKGKEYEGSLGAGVHNAEDFHHDVIEDIEEK